MEMKEKELAEREAAEQREQGGPTSPKKKPGGLIGIAAAGIIGLSLAFWIFAGNSKVVSDTEAKFISTGGRVFVIAQDANSSREYQAPCVFPAVKNGTLIVHTPDPEASYTGEARIGKRKIQGVVFQGRVDVYHTDKNGDVIGEVEHE